VVENVSMEQKNLQCPHCREMNYPMVEFCRYCGESLHARAAAVRSGLLVKWIHHAIDAMFWVVDETVRWWEIGKLSIMLKSLRRQRSGILFRLESESPESPAYLEQQHALVGITEELARLSNREEFLRSRCWAMTPDILFTFIFLVFLYGLLVINPARTMLPRRALETAAFRGEVSRVRDIANRSHTVVTVAEWFDNKLYVGGDGGLVVVDTDSGVASIAVQLPDNFFVRDLVVDENRLFVAGFSGVYVIENTVLKPFYHDNQLPVKQINSLAIAGRDRILLGTIGRGMLRGNAESAVMVLGTQNRTIKSFGRLGNEMWIMHEDGILTGRSDNFEPLNLQVLAGRHLRSMITTERNVFIGTDQGVVAGYRNARNWVWTLLSAGKPGFVNDLVVSGDILFIGSDEGVYRFYKGRMDRLSAVACHALALGRNFLAAVNPDSIMLFYFTGVANEGFKISKTIPEIGTFTPQIPVVSMLPLPRLQYGRMPDFSLLEQAAAVTLPLTESQVATAPSNVGTKPHVPLPSELQKPVFSDIVKVGDRYFLATENRGVWSFDGEDWAMLDGLPQTGASSLVCHGNSCFVYGASVGIYKVNQDSGELLTGPETTVGLMHVSVDENRLLLLFRDGSIKSFVDGSVKPLYGIPGEFKGVFNSAWKLGKSYLVVVDKGVMVHESEKQWNLIFFKGRIDNARVAAVERGVEDNLFIALDDGRVFEFKEDRLDFLGVVNDRPVALNFDGYLWVAGRDSLFFLENKSFVPAPFHTSDRILGAFPQPEKNSILVFTDFGVKLIAGR